MSQLRVESFAHLEGPVEDFLALPKRVEGLDDGQARAEARGTRALLDPGNTYYQNASGRFFVAHRGDEAVGRLAAFHNRSLVEQDRPVGLVGLFACRDDREAASELVAAAAAWLRGEGLRVMRGPMAGDIWHRWRFMTRGFSTTPFAGEPRQPEYYPELFRVCGFAPVRIYSTKLIDDLPAQLARFKKAEAVSRHQGYSFRSFDRDRWTEDIAHLHELCHHSFAISWSMTPTTLEEFADIYTNWLTRVGSDDIILAEDKRGAVVGLGLSVVTPEDTLNIRTIAVLPDHCGCGLGQAIGAEHYRRAIDSGKRYVNHCLMGPMTAPLRWDHGHGRVTREYAMYERGIG